MHQFTTPSLSQTIWPRWALRQFLSLPIAQTLLLWLLVIPKAHRLSLWDNWGDERGCDEGHWYAHTRGLRWGLAEFVGTMQQVHCSRRRLLRRGLEFHVSTINKSAHTNKGLETYLMILVYIVTGTWWQFLAYAITRPRITNSHLAQLTLFKLIYIYIYIYMCVCVCVCVYKCVCISVCVCVCV